MFLPIELTALERRFVELTECYGWEIALALCCDTVPCKVLSGCTMDELQKAQGAGEGERD